MGETSDNRRETVLRGVRSSEEPDRAHLRSGRLAQQTAATGAMLVLAMLAACQPPNTDGAPSATMTTVRGTVTYRERIALPADATIEVRLEDVSRADAAATVIAQQTTGAAGRQVPIPFELGVAPERIEPNRSYGLRAQIRAASGELMFATTSHYAVFDQGGAPRDIELVVQRVTGGARGPAAGDAAASTGSITGAAWRLVSLARAGQAAESVPAEPPYTIEFGVDGRYSGQAHCNRFMGGYERPAADQISIRGGAATLAACPEPSLAAEFLSALATATRYVVRGDTLELAADGGTTLTFSRQPARAAAPGVDEDERREAPWAEAKQRGATFRAVGNEPAWVLEVFPERLALITDFGESRAELSYTSPPATAGNTTTYRAGGDGYANIVAVVERVPCTDSMSGDAFEASTTVTFDGSTFRGCGRAL